MSFAERSEFVGEVLNRRYRIHGRIGLGGTGVVFEGTPVSGGENVAVKMLRQNYARHPDLVRRLRREAEVSRTVRHPGIVPVVDEGTLYDGSPYIVMPKMRGESLSHLLRRQGRLPCPEVAALAIRVASILHSAHAKGYTHRDVKPEHILMDRGAAGDLLVHLLDFGVCASAARPSEEHESEIGKVYGTPTYVSPEQAAGRPDVDGRADLFSLGVVIFEAVTGRVPFVELPVSKLLLRIIQKDAPRLRTLAPDADPVLDAVVARLLSRDPESRPRCAQTLARALAPVAGDLEISEMRLSARLNTCSRVADNAPTVRGTLASRLAAA